MGGSAQEKKYLKVKVFSSFTRLCHSVSLTFRLSGNNRVTKIKKLWGYALFSSPNQSCLVREVISCPCLTHTQFTHPPAYFFFAFFFAFFAAALPLAVYGYFLPFTIGMLALLCY